jgi:peroxidase
MLKSQARTLRDGDRFWFETNDPIIRFTPEQLKEIRKANMARIICDNGGNVGKVQKNPLFQANDADNKRVECSEIQNVDLRVFKEY